jgi:hypothetical protein
MAYNQGVRGAADSRTRMIAIEMLRRGRDGVCPPKSLPFQDLDPTMLSGLRRNFFVDAAEEGFGILEEKGFWPEMGPFSRVFGPFSRGIPGPLGSIELDGGPSGWPTTMRAAG